MTETGEGTVDSIVRLAREVAQLGPRERTRMFKLVGSLQNPDEAAYHIAQDPLLEAARRGWKSLTLREEQVLSFVVGGLANKEIAARLKISQRTVELHRSRCIHKLCAKNTADLCRIVSILGVPKGDGVGRSA